MVLKTITIIGNHPSPLQQQGCNSDDLSLSPSPSRWTWKISSQAGLEHLLLKLGVESLVLFNDASACHVTDYLALVEGGKYSLGETCATVELLDLKTKKKESQQMPNAAKSKTHS